MEQLDIIYTMLPELIERTLAGWVDEVVRAREACQSMAVDGIAQATELRTAVNRLAVLGSWDELEPCERRVMAEALNRVYESYLHAQQPALSFDVSSHSKGLVRWNYPQKDVFACLLHVANLFRESDLGDDVSSSPEVLLHALDQWARTNREVLCLFSELVEDLHLQV